MTVLPGSSDVEVGARVGRYVVERLVAERNGARWLIASPFDATDTVCLLQRVSRAPGSEPFAYREFLDRARAQRRLDHPQVVRVLEVGTTGDDLLVVYEYVPGWSLEQVLSTCARRAYPVPLGWACDVMVDALRGLDAAHRTVRLVHGALDLSEIRITPGGRGKVKGFARARAQPHGRYRSPEELRGQVPTPASDVFTAGLLLYELLTGHPVLAQYAADVSGEALLYAPIADPRELNPTLPAALAELVLGAVARKSGQRLRDAGDLARRLEAAAEALRAASPPPTELLSWLSNEIRPVRAVGRPTSASQPAAAPAGAAKNKPSNRERLTAGASLPRLAWAVALGSCLGATVVFWPSIREAIQLFLDPGAPTALPPSALVPKPMPPDFPLPPGLRGPGSTPAAEPGRKQPAPEPTPPEATGIVTLVTQPPTQVRFRGELLGRTPLWRTKLPAGIQTLEFTLPTGATRKVPVQVEEGKTTTLRLDLRE